MSITDEARGPLEPSPGSESGPRPPEPTTPTVMFVDDEHEVLSGLRLGLRRHRDRYRFLFASSVDEAIAHLDAEPVDMVITDMRMPVRSGVDLLEEVRFRFPGIVRYVLSGQAEDRLVNRSVAVTHRWLTKPCSAEVLLAAIGEATGHRSQVPDPQVRRAIGAVDALPSHPDIYRALLDEFAKAEPSVERVATLAAGDLGAATKLLQWANSGYSDADPIYDIRRAIDRIGLESLGPLMKANDIIRPFASSEIIPGFGIDLFRRHSRAVAVLAGGLTSPDQAALASTGGLLCDVGLLVEVAHLRDRLDLAYQRSVGDDTDLRTTERSLFGIDQAEVGSKLLALWGLPSLLVGTVAQSHEPPDPDATLPLSPLNAVRAARLMMQRHPLARAIGQPHRTPIDGEMADALSRWEDAIEQGVRSDLEQALNR